MGRTPTREGKPVGRVPGVPVPSSAKNTRANRVKNWKHGRRAQVVSVVEARLSRLTKVHEDAPRIFADIVDAMEGNGFDGVNLMGAQAITETEILRRQAVDKVNDDGVTVTDQLLSKDGEVIGERLRAHPLLEHVHRFNETLGFTAADMQLSRKSRGEGEKDAAMTAMLKRDAMLRSADKSDFPLPPSKLLPPGTP